MDKFFDGNLIEKSLGEDALKEYRENLTLINPEAEKELTVKLEDDTFKENFINSLLETSFLVSAAMAIPEEGAWQGEELITFDKVAKKILYNARQDITEVVQMRSLYLQNLSSDDIKEILTEENEVQLFESRLKDFVSKYLELVGHKLG